MNVIRELPSQSTKTRKFHTGFLVNLSSNVITLVVETLVVLWFTPYLIDHLGIAAYGIVPLANSIAGYMQIFTSSLNSAVSRFLTIDLQKGDAINANKTFNTALYGTIGIIMALSPFIVTASIAFPYLFDVPTGWEKDSSWIMLAVALSLITYVVTSNFAISSFAHSQFLLRNIVRLLSLSARILFVVALFTLFSPRLLYVGGGLLVAAFVSFAGNLVLWRKLTPELRVSKQAFDRSRLKSLMGMGGWMVVQRIGSMLLSRIDLVVVNIFFGSAATGGYGSVLQFSYLIDSLASAASTAVRPAIIRKYVQKDTVGLQQLSSQAVKLLGLMLSLPVGLICGFSGSLLNVWLGPSFKDLNVVLIFVVVHLGMSLSALPLIYIQSAYNKVRLPGIVTLISGVVNLGFAIFLASWGKWGVVGVAVAGAFVWTVKNAVFLPIYTASIMRLKWWVFLPSLSASMIGTLSVGIVAYTSTFVHMPISWFALARSATIVSIIYGVGVSAIALNLADWKLINDILPWKLKKGQLSR